MTSLTLAAFFTAPKKCILRVLLGKQLSEDTYLIADDSGTGKITAEESFTKGKKYLVKGKFIRIVLPSVVSIHDTVLLNSNTTVIPCVPFPTVDFPETCDFQSARNDTSLKMAATMAPGDIVSSILVKIVHIGFSKTIHTGSKVVRLTVKDKEGNKNFLSAWNRKIDLFQLNKIYAIRNVKVENFPPNQEKKYLSTMQNTSVTEMTDVESFCNISMSDRTLKGKCIGVTQFYFYFSCPICCKKIADKNNNTCSFCMHEYDFATDDYKAELLICENDDVETCVIFKSKIDSVLEAPNVVHESANDVETRVNSDLMDKIIEVDVSDQQNGDPVVQTIKFST